MGRGWNIRNADGIKFKESEKSYKHLKKINKETSIILPTLRIALWTAVY